MDARLVALGVAIIAVSSGFAAYSLYAGMGSAAGASLSAIVFGGVLAAIGYTYRDPLSDAVLRYSSSISSVLLKVYEDMGLLGGESLRACLKDGKVLVVFSKKPVSCSEVEPGIGVSEASPYMAIPSEVASEGGDPQQAISELGFSERVSVKRSGESVSVELIGVKKELLGGGWRPLNPVQVLIPAYLSSSLGVSLERVEEEFAGGVYRAEFRVIEE